MEHCSEFLDNATIPVRGFLHHPVTPSGDWLVLTHGAGSNCQSPLLTALAGAFAASGVSVLRCDLSVRMVHRQEEVPSEISMDSKPQSNPLAGTALFECFLAAIPTEGGKRLWPQRAIRRWLQACCCSRIPFTLRGGPLSCERITSHIYKPQHCLCMARGMALARFRRWKKPEPKFRRRMSCRLCRARGTT